MRIFPISLARLRPILVIRHACLLAVVIFKKDTQKKGAIMARLINRQYSLEKRHHYQKIASNCFTGGKAKKMTKA
jgi:hypothetical protein